MKNIEKHRKKVIFTIFTQFSGISTKPKIKLGIITGYHSFSKFIIAVRQMKKYLITPCLTSLVGVTIFTGVHPGGLIYGGGHPSVRKKENLTGVQVKIQLYC